MNENIRFKVELEAWQTRFQKLEDMYHTLKSQLPADSPLNNLQIPSLDVSAIPEYRQVATVTPVKVEETVKPENVSVTQHHAKMLCS